MTLVELLVALTLLALLSATLFGTLHVGAKAVSATQTISTAMDEIVFSQTFLQQHLSEALAPTPGSPRRDPSMAGRFAGGGSGLVFTAPWLTHIGQGALFEFTLAMEDDNLVLSWRPIGRLLDPDRATESELIGRRVIASNVGEVAIGYYGDPEARQGLRWHSAWNENGVLPQLVRVELAFHGGTRKRWPPLVVMLAT